MTKNYRILSVALLCIALLAGCLEEEKAPSGSWTAEEYVSGTVDGAFTPPPAGVPPVSLPQGSEEAYSPEPEQPQSQPQMWQSPASPAAESADMTSEAHVSAEPPQGVPESDPEEPAEYGTALRSVDSASDRGVAAGEIDSDAFERELLRLINAEREENGRSALATEEDMRWAARIRAAEVLDSLSHTRPDGTPYYTAFDEAGFSYAGRWHGENVSCMLFTKGSYDAVSAAGYMFGELKSSPGHYTNMLSGNFTLIGIGAEVRVDGDGRVSIGSAQMFAG